MKIQHFVTATAMAFLTLSVITGAGARAQSDDAQVKDGVAGQVSRNRLWLREQEKASADLHQHTEVPAFLRNQPLRPLAQEDRAFIDGVAEKNRQAGSQPAGVAYYFVSFSVPDAGLKRMLQETRRFGIPANVRGLVNNSLRETVQRVQGLVQNSGADGVQINPMLFRDYNIRSVPVLLVQCEAGVDMVRGNLRIEEGLKRIAAEGDCAQEAKKLLKQGGIDAQ